MGTIRKISTYNLPSQTLAVPLYVFAQELRSTMSARYKRLDECEVCKVVSKYNQEGRTQQANVWAANFQEFVELPAKKVCNRHSETVGGTR